MYIKCLHLKKSKEGDVTRGANRRTVEGDEDTNGIWEMNKFVRDEGIKEIALLERL
jgi:hypothetical protein